MYQPTSDTLILALADDSMKVLKRKHYKFLKDILHTQVRDSKHTSFPTAWQDFVLGLFQPLFHPPNHTYCQLKPQEPTIDTNKFFGKVLNKKLIQMNNFMFMLYYYMQANITQGTCNKILKDQIWSYSIPSFMHYMPQKNTSIRDIQNSLHHLDPLLARFAL